MVTHTYDCTTTSTSPSNRKRNKCHIKETNNITDRSGLLFGMYKGKCNVLSKPNVKIRY